ncbi:MAG: nuclear transport factor 2 family protein [Gemmataceae bacterium]
MADESGRIEVAATIQRINRAWLDGRPADLGDLFHPSLTMVLPGFSGKVEGREANIAAFVDFCNHAKVHEFKERHQQIDVVGQTAVASFAYEMLYERSGNRYRASGRDLWVFVRQSQGWQAIWRTMLDLAEEPA